MADAYISEIKLVPYNFAPRGWAFCHGQILSIAQNTALFSLLGTTYGGNGQTTFALPDLRGRVPIHMGQGPGLSSYIIGQEGGEVSHTLTTAEMPAHNHSVSASADVGTSNSPAGRHPAKAPFALGHVYGTSSNATSNEMIANAGGSQPHNNQMPYLGLNYCICLEGVFPSRN